MLIETIQSTTPTKKPDLRVGNLKRSLAWKSTQNKKMTTERDDALDQSKIDRAQFLVTKKKKNKKVENSNKTVQDAQSSVHGAQ